ncbi:hypothetical protein [Dryocola sp. LX212]
MKFVDSVLKMHSAVEVAVILNSGKEQFTESFFSRERLHIYDYGENLGYMQAAAEGLKEYLSNNLLPSWIILSNTDISFPDDGFFEKLSKDKRHDFILAPDIVSSDGIHQNPFLINRPSKNKLLMLSRINSHPLLASLYSLLAKIKGRIKSSTKRVKPESSFIYAPHGSFIIIGDQYFKRGESLDHPAFLYGEELFIAERARRSHISVYYDEGYKIHHAEHVTTAKMSTKFKADALRNSLDIVIQKYYNR